MTDSYLTERHLRLPDGSFPHLGVRGDGDVADVVLLSGSPDRVELMVDRLENPKRVGDRRGYAVYTGSYEGVQISVATSGVGSPSLAIAVEELGACGGRVFIRVGSCAAIDEGLRIGGMVIATGAVRDEGTSNYYAPMNFPAVSGYRVVRSLVEAAENLDVDYHLGLTRSTDSFYEGERDEATIDRWRQLGVLTFEMESSALFTVAAARGWEAGSILVAGSNLVIGEATYRGERVDDYSKGQQRMLEVALRAAARMAIAESAP